MIVYIDSPIILQSGTNTTLVWGVGKIQEVNFDLYRQFGFSGEMGGHDTLRANTMEVDG
jgi:hypothetical protein